MKTIEIEEIFDQKPSVVWKIISDLSRTDWVPGVEEISLEGDTREFFMEGMGTVSYTPLTLPTKA